MYVRMAYCPSVRFIGWCCQQKDEITPLILGLDPCQREFSAFCLRNHFWSFSCLLNHDLKYLMIKNLKLIVNNFFYQIYLC